MNDNSVVHRLDNLRDSCHLSISLIDSSRHEHPQSTDFALIRTDLLSILAILHQSVTKLSLVLNPSSPSYSAALSPLKDISDRVAAISHCVRLFKSSHGLALVAEADSLVKQVLEAIRDLAQSLRDASDDYLVRTALVHELIDKARSPDGSLSVDNVSAVRKLWLRDQASLDDGFNELAEMIGSNDAEDDDNDGWDELGISTKKMSALELERAKMAQVILRFSTMLHKRVSRDILSVAYASEFNSHLDTLPRLSSALLEVSDELISTIYSPQNEENLASELGSFKKVIENLKSNIHPLLEQKGKTRLWFTTCFDQIFKAVDALSSHCPSAISPSSLP